MRARTLELALITTGAVGAADIDGRNRELRKVDLLPTGGRGPHAPQIDQRHAAVMLIGLGSASVAAQAGIIAPQYARLIDPLNPSGGTLLDALAAMLSDPELACSVDEIRFCRTRQWVMVVYHDGRKVTYHPHDLEIDWKMFDPNKHGTSGGREEYVVGSTLLQQIAIDFAFKQEIYE
jgi:hypothetical protein